MVDENINCTEYRYQDVISCPAYEWSYCSQSGDEFFDTGCEEDSVEIEIPKRSFNIPLGRFSE